MARKILLFLGLFYSFSSFSTEDLVTLSAAYLPDQKILALNFDNEDGWHTYWKNPGDAGLPIKIRFSIDGGKISLRAREWPTPQKFREKGNIIAYGYGGAYSLFFDIPEGLLTNFQGRALDILAEFLVCKDICIPQEVKLSIPLDLNFQTPKPKLTASELEKRLSLLPKMASLPPYLDLTVGLNESQTAFIFLYSVSEEVASPNHKLNLLTPFPHDLFDFKHESLQKDIKGHLYGQIPADWHGHYASPEVPFPKDGVFSPPQKVSFLFNDPIKKRVFVIEKEFHFFNPKSALQVKDFMEDLKDYQLEDPLPSSNILLYILFGFLGGLILNLMPCVLPVISIKLFRLIKHAERPQREVLKHNIAYTLGVLATFMLLGLTIVSLKYIGVSVGWGFQLQSPHFMAVTIIVLLILTLNFFGLFEFKTPGGQALGNVHLNEGFWGDFATGILSTILSTPCSAPFLGAALTFAFHSPTAIILLIFTSIGLGLSFPFIIIGLFPALISFLPSPGVWMEHLKKFLGLSLLLTAVWALDIFNTQVGGGTPFLQLAIAMSLFFFAFYFRAHISKGMLSGTLAFLLPILLFVHLMLSPLEYKGPQRSSFLHSWEEWSVEKMETYRRENKKVFIDFTAKWCFTCKVNEKLVLDTENFRTFAKDNDIKLLLADWTLRDPVIGRWLKSQGFVGVPAYFAIKDGRLIKLGETISLKKIQQAFK